MNKEPQRDLIVEYKETYRSFYEFLYPDGHDYFTEEFGEVVDGEEIEREIDKNE